MAIVNADWQSRTITAIPAQTAVASSADFYYIKQGESVTVQSSGGAMGGGESIAVLLHDPLTPGTPIPHKQSAAAIVVDADNTARTIYGPGIFGFSKTVTVGTRGVVLIR